MSVASGKTARQASLAHAGAANATSGKIDPIMMARATLSRIDDMMSDLLLRKRRCQLAVSEGCDVARGASTPGT